MASQDSTRTQDGASPSTSGQQQLDVQDPALTPYALQSFMDQSPAEGNVLMTLPHANSNADEGRLHAVIDTVDGQLWAGHAQAPAFTHATQGSGPQGHAQPTSRQAVDTHRRRKHKRQSQQLTGVGEQFPQQTAITAMLQQGMMNDLNSLHQQSQHPQHQQQAHIDPFFMSHEVVYHQTQEGMNEDIHGVDGQFQ